MSPPAPVQRCDRCGFTYRPDEAGRAGADVVAEAGGGAAARRPRPATGLEGPDLELLAVGDAVAPLLLLDPAEPHELRQRLVDPLP